jgi:hypothetical protein
MLYAALTFWLLVIVFAAAGVHRLWSRLIRPRVVNFILLPGTLIAQLGHVLGLLVTGNSVKNTKLMGDGEAGEPKSETPKEQRIPVIGPIIVGLLPLIACAACLYVAARYWGVGMLRGLEIGAGGAASELPLTIGGVFALLRSAVTLVEHLVTTIADRDLLHVTTVLFLYVATCLTVRMAPFDGNRRGAIGAIVLAGVVIAVLGSLSNVARDFVLSSWPCREPRFF